MSRWFRSEHMQYISLILNEDAAHDCLTELGTLGAVQFTDLNPELTPFQRRFVTYVKRCDELERKLRFFANECDKFDMQIDSAGNVDEFLSQTLQSPKTNRKTGNQILETLEIELERYESQLRELNSYSEKLTTEYNEKVELQEVLEKAREFFVTDASSFQFSKSSSKGPRSPGKRTENLLEDGSEGRHDMDLRFSSITGVVASDEKVRFERMIFRATRGNVYVRFAPVMEELKDPETGKSISRIVFVVFYKSLSIEVKLKKICDAFGAHRYALPDIDDAPAVNRMMTENKQELVDSRTVLMKNSEARYRLCKLLARNTEKWTWVVLREKTVYHTLNMLKADVQGMLRAEGWVIQDSVSTVRQYVMDAHATMDLRMPSLVESVPKPWPTPPTHFALNKFTYGYQEFVNTYGIPRYREANPALFTAATFPFLFGVMYGDIGHGTFLFCFGLYLLWNEKKHDEAKLSEIFGGMHMGRYMLVMMGFFAIYAGLVYNDCFALGINFFGSRWYYEGQDTMEVLDTTQATQLGEFGSDESVYIFGLDPAWKVSSNELLFFNSFKMKLSVVLGIIQMFSGTCLKGMNAIYFKKRLDFLFEFLPMLCFSVSLFIYMIFLIFMKWSINWNSRMLSSTCLDPSSEGWGSSDYKGEWGECNSDLCTPWGYSCEGGEDLTVLCPLGYGGSGNGCQPPNLITTLINIALSPGVVDEPMYNGQPMIQNFLLALALISVPILLFAKPYFMSKEAANSTVHHSDDDDEVHEDHSFGEIIIHQAIETIEFVLGMVSNTASYLRLWALSLAHSELASVFWGKAMLATLNTNWFAAYFGYGIFAGITFGVLLMMDVLECFLHALRLHWVEFQNKFFYADGIRFTPFSVKKTITEHSH